MRRVDKNTAKQMIAEKQSVEVGLALDVKEIFDVEMIQDLRQLCQNSIKRVDAMAQRDPLFTQTYPRKWAFYGCMRGMGQWNAGSLLRQTRSWKATDCGEWIRVYGEIVEENFFGPREEANRKAAQRGDPSHWKKPKVPKAARGQEWGDQHLDQQNFQPQALRRRVQYNNLTYGDQGLYDGETTPSGFLMKSMPSSGIQKWAIMANDVTGKMDRVFGLMKGATISGTTTDTVYFLNKFARAIRDPILYLLAVGHLVGNGHHSLLEVAIPLTLNGFMEYSVGLYSTLIRPIFRRVQIRPALRQKGADALQGVFERWENHPNNHLMMCYYERGELAGALVADKNLGGNRAVWKLGFTADEGLMTAFAAMPINPTYANLLGFLRQRGISIG